MNRSRLVLIGVAAVVGAALGVVLTTVDFRRADFAAALVRAMPSILLWVGFFVYWSIAARNSGSTQNSESKGSTAVHQVLLNIALLLLILPVPGLTKQLLPATQAFEIAGAAVQIGFIALAVWARVHLGRNWAAEVRIAKGHELVKTGPYRWLRHPIYTAMLGMFVATAIATGELHSAIALALMAALYRRKIALEENILRETFGAKWDEYRSATWALVPLVF